MVWWVWVLGTYLLVAVVIPSLIGLGLNVRDRVRLRRVLRERDPWRGPIPG
jgi:hypothetical protein